MEDLLVKYAPQFVTITLIAMFLTELVPIKWVGKMADKDSDTVVGRNGTRRPLSALLYSYVLSLLGWGAGVLVNIPEPPDGVPVVAGGLMFLALMSISSVVAAHMAVKAKKLVSS